MSRESTIVRAAVESILCEIGQGVGPGSARDTLEDFARRLDDLEEPELAAIVIESLGRPG